MEIKQGDKVRVSKDAPKMYVPVSFWTEGNSIVEEIHEGNAAICYESNYVDFRIVVPIKYLLVNVNGVWKKPKTKQKRTRKVDAEAKEAKFKVGEEMFWLPSKTIRHKCTITEVIKNEHSGKWEYNVLFEWGKPGKWIPESELALYTEPTAPKFKVGDRIKFKNIYELQKVKDKSFRWMLVMFASKEATITAVEDNGFYRVDIDPSIGGINDDMIECKVEPTEQTVAEEDTRIRQMEAELDDFRKAELDRVLHPEKYYTYEATIDNMAMNWPRYEADLAKEVALKVANKYNDPKQLADYAVKVAKSVVEGLKRK